MGLSIVASLVTAMLASPMWLLLAARIGKYRAWLLFNLASIFVTLLYFIPQGRCCCLTTLLELDACTTRIMGPSHERMAGRYCGWVKQLSARNVRAASGSGVFETTCVICLHFLHQL